MKIRVGQLRRLVKEAFADELGTTQPDGKYVAEPSNKTKRFQALYKKAISYVGVDEGQQQRLYHVMWDAFNLGRHGTED